MGDDIYRLQFPFHCFFPLFLPFLSHPSHPTSTFPNPCFPFPIPSPSPPSLYPFLPYLPIPPLLSPFPFPSSPSHFPFLHLQWEYTHAAGIAAAWRCLGFIVSMSVYHCLSHCEDISGTTCAIFTKILTHVAYGRGSIFLRRMGRRLLSTVAFFICDSLVCSFFRSNWNHSPSI